MFLLIAFFILATSLPASAQAPVRPLKEQIKSGDFLFAARGCSSCHAVKGKGGTSGPDLTRVTVWASPILGAAVMWNHVPLMAKARKEGGMDWPDFTAQEIGDIFAFLHSLNPRKGSAYALKGDALEGEARFLGTCQKCHGPAFKGGGIAPDLGARAAEMKSEGEFAARMLRHAPRMAPIARRMNIPWPQLTGSEMAGIFLYLKSLKPAQ
jgi:mono/diheme cytochrome c family protein